MKDTVALDDSAITKAAPAVPKERAREEIDVRSAVRDWLLTVGDKGVAGLYSRIQEASNQRDAAARRQQMLPSLYLYWLIAQISGQDTERRWRDVLGVSHEQGIPLNKQVDEQIAALVKELTDAGPAQRAAPAHRVQIRPLKQFSEAARTPDDALYKSEGSDQWERVNFSSLRRADHVVFGT